MARARSPLYLPLHRSGLRRSALRLLCPLLTSALRSGRLTPISVSNPRHRRRSPEVKPTAFTARPPDLPPRSLMAADFAIICSLVRPGRPLYPVLVHQAAALLHASFRPHLAMTPLRFANPSPPSGWIEDFHLQAVVHTRHTTHGPRAVKKHGEGTTGSAGSSGIPCAMVLTVSFALSPGTGLSCPCREQIALLT